MSNTWIWILAGLLAVGVGAIALVTLQPHPAVAAATQPMTDAKGSVGEAVAAAPVATADEPAASTEPASGEGSTTGAAGQPGAAALSATPTVDDLIQNAAAYEGQTVSLQGTILTQCTAGCEFALDDGTGALSVQLEGAGKDRLLPLGEVGKKIAVHGVFHASPRPQVVIDDPNGWQFAK